MNEIIVISEITKIYGQKRVVDNISFSIKSGEILGLIGKNGAGKTTIMKIIMRIIQKNNGKVIIGGYDIDTNPKMALSRIGCSIETPNHFNYLTGYENLWLSANLMENVNKTQINEMLTMVGLIQKANEKVKTYSMGMKQRLAIARALLGEPKIIILDEPVNGLDPQGMQEIYTMIKQYANDKKISFLISSHLLHDMEGICDRIVVIDEGKSVYEGSMSDILKESGKSVKVFCADSQDVNALKIVLQKYYGLTITDISTDSINIKLRTISFTELNRIVVNSNINITNIVQNSGKLEDLFFNLTGSE